MNVDFLVSAAYQRAQLVAQHAGVAARDDDVGVGFCAEASHRALKLFDVLHLVNKNKIVLVGSEMVVKIFVKVLISLDVVKLSLFLVDIDYVVARILHLLLAHHFHHVAFAHTTLSHKHDDGFFAKIFFNLVHVASSVDCFHRFLSFIKEILRKYTTFIFYNEQNLYFSYFYLL